MLYTLKNLGLILYYVIESFFLMLIPRSLRYKDINTDNALITGAGSGIGRMLAILLARRVAKIVIVDINETGLKETQQLVIKEGGKCFSYKCDLSERKEIYEMANKVKDDVGAITILINNAGIVFGKNLLDLTDEQILKTFDVNTFAHFWLYKAFLPDMMKINRGHIVTLSSVASFCGSAKITDYSASKAASTLLTESLFLEMKKSGYDGINVSVVMPYQINTGMFTGAGNMLVPILEPEYVAAEIIDAMLVNQEIVILPRMFGLIYVIRTLLPIKAAYHLYLTLRGDKFMDGFVGRNTKIENNNQNNNQIATE